MLVMNGRDTGEAIGDEVVCFSQRSGRLPRPYENGLGLPGGVEIGMIWLGRSSKQAAGD